MYIAHTVDLPANHTKVALYLLLINLINSLGSCYSHFFYLFDVAIFWPGNLWLHPGLRLASTGRYLASLYSTPLLWDSPNSPLTSDVLLYQIYMECLRAKHSTAWMYQTLYFHHIAAGLHLISLTSCNISCFHVKSSLSKCGECSRRGLDTLTTSFLGLMS